MNRQARSSGPSRASKMPFVWWISALLVLGVIAVYWPVVGYGFVDYDDQEYVWVNPHVAAGLTWPGVVWAFTTFYAANWHPLTWLSHMLDVQLFGMHAGGHHAVNVLFHAANTVLLFLLLKRLTGAIWRSAFVAALFGFHPLHVESVAWVAERKDVLSTFFFMLTLFFYTRYAQGRSKVESRGSNAATAGPALVSRLWSLDYAFAVLLFALGLMSKPMLVTLPFVLLLLDYWPLGRLLTSDLRPLKFRSILPLLREKLPFFALAAASCVVTILAQKNALVPISDTAFEERLQNAVVSYSIYLEKMLWPAPLAAFYPYFTVKPETTAIAAFVLLLISAAVFVSPRRRPYLAVGWLWFLGTLVPVIGLIQVGMQAMADRYTYVPLIGAFIALTWLVAEITDQWRYQRTVLAVLALGALTACFGLTSVQVRYWRNSETLSRHALATTTDNAPMQQLLGNAFLLQKKPEEAARHFAEAARICPDSAPIQSDLALALATEGKFDEAIATYRIALKIKPHEIKPRYTLANLLAVQGKYHEAIEEYQATLQEDHDHLLALNDLAWILATAPDPHLRNGAEAVELAEKACQLTNYKTTLFVGTLAAAYAEAGQFDDAIKSADKAIIMATVEGNKTLVAKNKELLELYRARKAYHESAGH